MIKIKFFIDSSILAEIQQIKEANVLDGITTNPSLIKKAVEDLKSKNKKINLESYIKQILKTAKGIPVSLEVTKYDYEGMVEEGKNLFKKFNPVARNVYIKIPINPSFSEDSSKVFDGVKAIKTLSRLKIPINCTLVFTPEQALMAAKAGAKFVSPFAGRIDDLIRERANIKFEKSDYFPEQGWKKWMKILEDNGIVSGVDLIRKCAQIFNTYNIKAEVLAGSIRNARQLREVALAGANIATMPFYVFKEALSHIKTIEGMKNFTEDVVKEYADLGE